MKDYIGTVLHFDENSYDASISAYNRVLKVVDVAGEAYEALDTTFKFDQEVFKDMIVNRSAHNIHKKYAAIIDAQIKSLNFTSKTVIDSMKAQIPLDIQTLQEKIEKVFEAIFTLGTYSRYTIHFNVSNISIVDGKATITDETKERIKDLCEIKIRTEDQSTLYNLALKLQEGYKIFVDFIKEKNTVIMQSPYPSTIFHYNGGKFSEIAGQLQIKPHVIFGI